MNVKMLTWPNFVEPIKIILSMFSVFHLLLIAHLLKFLFLAMDCLKLPLMFIMELLLLTWRWVKVVHHACMIMSTITLNKIHQKSSMNSGKRITTNLAQHVLSTEKLIPNLKCTLQLKVSCQSVRWPSSNKTKTVNFGTGTLNILEHIILLLWLHISPAVILNNGPNGI